MATRGRLIRSILQELGSWQAGQDLPPEDYNLVDEKLDAKLLAMGAADVYTVEDTADIPDEAVEELAVYLAGEYAQNFGLAGEELAAVKANAGRADQALRYLRKRGPTYTIQAGEYF